MINKPEEISVELPAVNTRIGKSRYLFRVGLLDWLKLIKSGDLISLAAPRWPCFKALVLVDD